ncbi:hypothetical protein [uncultured Reyranella sp.]|uniref:hypothetical protein n=1 Tax=uncultured Reyranella sp. TaxID=735512 RepID=UPI00259C7347|nr:hypothetical protein [uncultured Reyranella sp.]
MDSEGDRWSGCSLLDGLDEIEQAINGEATTLNMVLTGEGEAAGDLVWLSYSTDQIVGATVRLLIQPCDEHDQPIGAREVMFTGRIDNKLFDDQVVDERQRSTMTVEVTNRFTLRRLKSGAVLSDADQRARAAAVNPEEEPDRFCERVPLLQDKTITWPRWR